jgi:hypothetical protein
MERFGDQIMRRRVREKSATLIAENGLEVRKTRLNLAKNHT